MSEYQLELKQIVDYPRCRIYRQFIGLLMKDKSIRVGGTSGLYHFTVLSCFANFRTSYKRIDGISYTIYPGEWLCRVSELTEWFRTRFQHQALAILRELQDRHLITYTLLGRGKLVKFKIKGWCRYNRVLEYNAPCQKDTGFFFLPISVANELVSAGRCSEMDAMLDLWINTVYNDTQVQGSEVGPVVYMRNGTGSPLIGYAELAQRWGVSKATAGRYLRKMQELGYLSMVAFPGTHGTAIYLKQYLSTMFQISDVMIDKDEVAMSLNIHIQLDEETEDGSVSENSSGVSKSHTEIILQKAAKILAAQGFPCFSCSRLQCKLLPLSDDCREAFIHICDLRKLKDYGDWVVRELSCPAHLVISEEAYKVTVSEMDQTIKITVVNKFLTGKVQVRKVSSKDHDKLLSGAEFVLYLDVNGNKAYDPDIDTLYGELSEADTGVYEIGDLKHGGYLLLETKAPDGFTKDDRYFYFRIQKDGETVIVENEIGVGFTNEPIPTSTPEYPDSPKTGDDSKLWLWILLASGSLTALITVGMASGKKRKAF